MESSFSYRCSGCAGCSWSMVVQTTSFIVSSCEVKDVGDGCSRGYDTKSAGMPLSLYHRKTMRRSLIRNSITSEATVSASYSSEVVGCGGGSGGCAP